jgi:hypothetical protein
MTGTAATAALCALMRLTKTVATNTAAMNSAPPALSDPVRMESSEGACVAESSEPFSANVSIEWAIGSGYEADFIVSNWR